MDMHRSEAAESVSGIEFNGTWREYLPIAISNVVLTIVTLGIYRFWAAARQRRYLWSRTRVMDDHLEWTGTGKEMFVGFVIVMVALLPFFLFVQFAFPAMVARGQNALAAAIFIGFYLGLIYLGGVASFRALRYRLSRTYWHGIRGGSDNPGWAFGFEVLWRMVVSGLTLFLAFPWASVRLWNRRWNAMSFGQLDFAAEHNTDGLKTRWLMIYVSIIGLWVVMGAVMMSAIAQGQNVAPETLMGNVMLIVVGFYIVLPMVVMNYYAKYYRLAAERTRLGNLEFGFNAGTFDWIKLFLGNIALAVVTLGFGIAYWGYRNWAFMVRHFEVYGDIDVSHLAQSATHAPGEAEGFADAFDIGAI